MGADFVEPKPIHKYPVKSGRDILEAQYRGGRSVIDRSDWARDAYESLRRRCPTVPEDQLVRLFNDRSASQLELIQGSATFAEYNAGHPLGRKKVKVKRPALRPVPTIVEVAKPAPKAPAKKAPAPPPPKAVAKPSAKKAVKPAKAAPKPPARKVAVKAAPKKKKR